MRVILDANIFISAAIASGPPLRALSTCIERADIDLIVCPTLWREVGHSLLTKPRLLMRVPPEETREFMRRIRPLVCFVPDPVVVEEFTKDHKDNYLIALAREQGVPIIVSGDRQCQHSYPETGPRQVPRIGATQHSAVLGHRTRQVPWLVTVQQRVKRAAFGFRRFAHYRIRALLYAGKPNWTLLAGLTPR